MSDYRGCTVTLCSPDYIAISVLDDSIMKMVGGDFEKTIQDLAKQKVEEIEAVSCATSTLNCTTINMSANWKCYVYIRNSYICVLLLFLYVNLLLFV